MSVEHFRFAPDVLSRLGEELVPHAEQGLIELVRNSYDADAVTCTVELTSDGTVRVVDDGDGMDAASLANGFLVVGRSQKAASGFTRLHRRQVGDKGLGRLAALRLGRFVSVVTRPRAEPGSQYTMSIDWRAFDNARVVEAVPIEIVRTTTKAKFGTTIEMRDLKMPLGRAQLRRLARGLLLLADPFSEVSNAFHPRLVAAEYEDLERRVKESYLGLSDYHLVASVNGEGRVKATVFDWHGTKVFQARADAFAGHRYKVPPATFELWTYLLGGSFAGRGASTAEIRNWLEVVGGAHIYYRQLRVYPYGEPGHDWLDMNLLRVRSPEERPSTNNSVGKVVVEDPQALLLQKTDRSGFVENESFLELKHFCVDVLDWMASVRLQAAERRRAEERKRLPQETERARKRVADVIATLPPRKRPQFEQAYERLEAVQRRQAERLRQDLLLYRTLGTVGTTIALFAHEAPRSLDQIRTMAQTIGVRTKRLIPAAEFVKLERPLHVILDSVNALQSFAQLPRRLLDQSRRRSGLLNVNESIGDVVDVFGDLATATKVNITCQLVDDDPKIHGTKAALDSVLANLISNSINAFISDSSPKAEGRRIQIDTGLNDKRITIRVSDNGPGIAGIELDDIWLPGRTTTPRGTGLGLTIVRDTVADLGGTVSAISRGSLGGAEFVVQLPRRE